MAFTMACPNFKKGLKMVFGPLGVNIVQKFYAKKIQSSLTLFWGCKEQLFSSLQTLL
jgi:hypothetical protein